MGQGSEHHWRIAACWQFSSVLEALGRHACFGVCRKVLCRPWCTAASHRLALHSKCLPHRTAAFSFTRNDEGLGSGVHRSKLGATVMAWRSLASILPARARGGRVRWILMWILRCNMVQVNETHALGESEG